MLVFALGLYRDKNLEGDLVEDWSSLGQWTRGTIQELGHLAMCEAMGSDPMGGRGPRDGPTIILVPFHRKGFSCLMAIARDTTHRRRLVVLTEATYPQRPLAALLLQHLPFLLDGSLPLRTLFDRLTSPPPETLRLEGLRAKLDQTKLVILDAVDKVLERGVKLDELVQKSDDLSQTSKMFYKRSKTLSSPCCTIS